MVYFFLVAWLKKANIFRTVSRLERCSSTAIEGISMVLAAMLRGLTIRLYVPRPVLGCSVGGARVAQF